MNKQRIVITGVGVVSCFGTDHQKFFQALLNGESGIKPIQGFGTENYTTKFAAEITDFDPNQFLDRKQARRVDKYIAYAIGASKQAMQHANLTEEARAKLDLAKCGVIIGSGMGGMGVFVDNVNALNESPRRVSPFLIPYIITNMAGGLLAQEMGFMGPNYSISTACATGTHSIIAAANHIRKGEAELMICGGSEAAIIPLGLAGFCSVKALSQRNDAPEKACRPWDTNRDGFVMGEGAGVIILETLEHALARGAPILAEYLGGAMTCDAYHMTDPHPEGEGVAKCLEMTLKDSQITQDQVQYINAHATSTPAGDMAEITALKRIFKDPGKIAINATKSMIGHCLGAAGGLEAVATVLSVQQQVIHPTLNLENPDSGLSFYAPTKATPWKIDTAISNSFGFGGHNASIAIGRYNER